MSKISTKKAWKGLKECGVVEFPQETPDFVKLRSNIWVVLQNELPYSYPPEKKTLDWMPEEGGYFIFKYPMNLSFPDDFGVDANEAILTYYIDPKRGIEKELNRVIDSVYKVKDWSEDNVWNRKRKVTEESARKIIEEAKNELTK